MGFLQFVKYLFNDIPLDYKGPESGYYVVPNDSQFTYSSVRSDFRLVPLADGCFAAAWKDFVVVRDSDGRPQWRADGTGYTVAPSFDGRQLLAFGAVSHELTRYDAHSGQALASAPLPPLPEPDSADSTSPGWAEQLVHRADGTTLVLLREGVGVLAADGRRWLAYYQQFFPNTEYQSNLDGMAWQPERPDEVLVFNDNTLVALDLRTGQVLRHAAVEAYHLLPGARGRQVLLSSFAEPAGFRLVDSVSLAVTSTYPFQGLEGVQTEAESQHGRSSTAWEKRAVLSPGGKYLLATDQSGLVWLFDAQSGYQLRIFRRELVNHAYDLLWLDDQFFLALTNRGHVVKVDIAELPGVFDVTDFTAADDARYQPRDYEIKSMRTLRTEAEVLAALDIIATTPDMAAYAAAWEVVHFAAADFDWARHLTAAHLEGAIRSYTWMLPEAGFASHALFAEMRQALLAVQYHLPTAPVAPVLALHDRVFGPQPDFDALEGGDEQQLIEYQLLDAYEQLKWELVDPEADDVETGLPFILSEHHQAYELLCEAIDNFLRLLTNGFGWEANSVVKHAFPHLADHYAQRLEALPAPLQRRLLEPIRWYPEPTAVALLQQLAANSPHPGVAGLARRALHEAGHLTA